MRGRVSNTMYALRYKMDGDRRLRSIEFCNDVLGNAAAADDVPNIVLPGSASFEATEVEWMRVAAGGPTTRPSAKLSNSAKWHPSTWNNHCNFVYHRFYRLCILWRTRFGYGIRITRQLGRNMNSPYDLDIGVCVYTYNFNRHIGK